MRGEFSDSGSGKRADPDVLSSSGGRLGQLPVSLCEGMAARRRVASLDSGLRFGPAARPARIEQRYRTG